jgi:hypothetical protein
MIYLIEYINEFGEVDLWYCKAESAEQCIKQFRETKHSLIIINITNETNRHQTEGVRFRIHNRRN